MANILALAPVMSTVRQSFNGSCASITSSDLGLVYVKVSLVYVQIWRPEGSAATTTLLLVLSFITPFGRSYLHLNR